MTFYQFRLLSAEVQLRYVLSEGAYLAQRWEGEEQGVGRHPFQPTAGNLPL